MYIHNLDPIFINFGFISIKWYSLAYIVGILSGWWLGRKIIVRLKNQTNSNFQFEDFDNLISWLIISIILGGRIGYVIFYNLNYYLQNPLNIFKVWEGGMSFHGALLGVIITVYYFSIKKNIKPFLIFDILACVTPIGLFFGRIANFINAELYGKPSNILWSVIFPRVDNLPRHPSQIYEAFLEGILLFLILNLVILKKNYKIGICSVLFLILYGLFRIISEQFREPDAHIGYLFSNLSMGAILSIFMILGGLIIFLKK